MLIDRCENTIEHNKIPNLKWFNQKMPTSTLISVINLEFLGIV